MRPDWAGDELFHMVAATPCRDNTTEPAQRKAYMDTIIENLGHGALTNRSLTWTHQVTAKLVVKGLGHQVVARSDELICAR